MNDYVKLVKETLKESSYDDDGRDYRDIKTSEIQSIIKKLKIKEIKKVRTRRSRSVRAENIVIEVETDIEVAHPGEHTHRMERIKQSIVKGLLSKGINIYKFSPESDVYIDGIFNKK